MTTSSKSNNVSKVPYFNVHTEGLGYLDSLVEVTPKAGQEFAPFWTATFCMLEGDPATPEKVYVSLTIPGDNVIDVLKPYLSDINHQDTKVFVGLRLAKLRALPFTFGDKSKSAGELGVNYSARLIKVISLKVGNNVIKLAESTDQASHHQKKPAASNNSQAKDDDTGLFTKPLIVKLSKDAPNFAVEKQLIAAAGYRWHSSMVAWVLPEVIVALDDAQYDDKVSFIEANGYRVGDDQVSWRMVFPPKSYSGYSKSTHQSASHH